MKSTHNWHWNIPYDELSNFIDPINMSINIPYYEITNLSHGEGKTLETLNYISMIYGKLLDYVPTLKQAIANKYCYPISCITYMPHTTGYDFRISPIDVINNIFTYLNLDYEIPFINLDNPEGMNFLQDTARTYIKDAKRVTNNRYVITVLDELNDNLDKICNFYYQDINQSIKNCCIPKDALLYLSYKSLLKFEETNDHRYMVMPYEYYKYVAHMQTSPYPHQISIINQPCKRWFTDFQREYESSVDVNITPDTSKLLLTDQEIFLALNILQPGMLEREIRDYKPRSAPNVDYDYYMKLFEMKMNYYMNSPYIYPIKGLYGLKGYLGFTYPNEYLIFDKFHNSDTIDASKKTVLTHGEAIFALPSDRFEANVISDKQRIIAARKADPRIIKINHTITGSFLKKLDKVIESPNVSTSTIEEELKKPQTKMLIIK